MPIPHGQEKITRTSTKERVYKTLRDWIVEGVLQPDERLNDKELAEHFAVSRTPVREALQMLVEQKFITIRPSSGTFVAPLDTQNMVQVYQLMGGLQCMALELCFDRISAQEVAGLRALNAAIMQLDALHNRKEISRADSAFHHFVAVLSGNDYLARFTDTLLLQTQRGENLFFDSDTRRTASYEQHSAVIDALDRRDLAAAQRAMRANWDVAFWQNVARG